MRLKGQERLYLLLSQAGPSFSRDAQSKIERRWVTYSKSSLDSNQHKPESSDTDVDKRARPLTGRMSQRLEQLTEDALEQGHTITVASIDSAGFSGDLKERLEERIKDSTFKSENLAALSSLTTPTYAGQGTQMLAHAEPWRDREPLSDSILRMLDDAHRPLGVKQHSPSTRIGSPIKASVDVRLRKGFQQTQGQRLAIARDRTSVYASSQDPQLSSDEREQIRQQLRDRFGTSARSVPATIQGMAALANRKIEDAIARGKFKGIARGKGKNVERDHNADSPFLDTTEYLLNKIIQKQEIMPPWIEKQQEMGRSAALFRSSLRREWKRHAARLIACQGGSLQEQIARAKEYAAAEAALKLGRQTRHNENESSSSVAKQQSIDNTRDSLSISTSDTHKEPSEQPSAPLPQPPRVFRDAEWEASELAYHTLSITNLNNLTRSYNLQAPEIAKKPYFQLKRELRNCFADVAPLIPNAIADRAQRGMRHSTSSREGSERPRFLEKFSGEQKTQVWDEKRPQYGFKQFWKDLFAS